jgi:prepilin-type N-terminal cleavage/methylation domain-containing protein
MNIKNSKKSDQTKLIQTKFGFSLLELSVVLLIISSLIIAIIKGSDLVDKAKLTSAAKKTTDSPVLKIDGLILWLEPTLSNSFLESEITDGGSISAWNDMSGLKTPNNFSQATQTKRPLYTRNAINDLPAIKFDGVDDFLSFSTFQFPYANYTIFVVFSTSNTSSSTDILSLDYSGDHGLILESQPNGIIKTLHRFPYSSSVGGDSFLSSSGQIINGNNYVLSYVRNLQAATSVVKLNSTTAISATPTIQSFNTDNLNLVIGSLMGTSRFFNGYISEIIIFNRVLSNQEQSDVESYLDQKYNLNAS